MAKVLHNGVLSQTCGVGEFGIFRSNGVAPSHMYPTVENVIGKGGAGWQIASFTDAGSDSAPYKEAYKELRKRFKIVYQSKVRTNKRTEHKFFFCLYDVNSKMGDARRAEHNEQWEKWPF